MTLTLRREVPADHRAVELLTREAFWGTENARCSEHLVVRRLRSSPSFVAELDVVAEVDGLVVGNVMWSRARVEGAGEVHDVLILGPLSVLPSHQGTGVGAALMRRTLDDAGRLGHRAAVVYGHPDYYPRFGFRPAGPVGITAPGGATFDALMARPLVDGGLDGIRGEVHEDPAFHVDAAMAEAFDLAEFPPKAPAPPARLAVLDGHVPGQVLTALRAAGVVDLTGVRRRSGRELAGIPGVGAAGADAVAEALRARGVAWGPERRPPDGAAPRRGGR